MPPGWGGGAVIRRGLRKHYKEEGLGHPLWGNQFGGSAESENQCSGHGQCQAKAGADQGQSCKAARAGRAPAAGAGKAYYPSCIGPLVH